MNATTEPYIYWVRRSAGIAGQFAVIARVGYPGESPVELTFTGSVYGGPVVMSTPSNPGGVFVSDPGRFGPFDEAWVRRFFGATE
jgi:hypothetical protein